MCAAVSYLRRKINLRLSKQRSDYLHTGSMLQEPLGRTRRGRIKHEKCGPSWRLLDGYGQFRSYE